MTKKIVFMGTPQFSVAVLEALIQNQYDVVAVVTQPDRPTGRKKVLTMSPVKMTALKYNIPVLQPEKLVGSIELEQLLNMQIDLIVTAAYGQFLPTKLLNHPTYRSINIHASLLPKYRGAAPIQYALMNGDQETGITIMYMEKEMDAGDIIATKKIAILPEDNVATLFEKLSIVGRDLLLDTLPSFFDQSIQAKPQNVNLVTYSPSISKEEERIDWQKSALIIHNKVRAMNSWPGAYTLLNGERIKIWETEVVSRTAEHSGGVVGQIIEKTATTLIVLCGQQSYLSLKVIQPSGKKVMAIDAFNRGVGANLTVGDKFENDFV